MGADVPVQKGQILKGPRVGKPMRVGMVTHRMVTRSSPSAQPLFIKPISKLNPEVLYRQIQYLVEEDDWASKGEEVIDLGGGG